MPGCDQAGAEAFAERVRHALAATDEPNLPGARVSAGITATVAPGDVRSMLERVDNALYAAKRGGRDRTVAYQAPDLSLVA